MNSSRRRTHLIVTLFFAALCITWLAAPSALAELVDFDDLSFGEYSTGQTFVSRGVTFEVGEYNGLTGQALVANAARAPGSGREIRLEKEDLLIMHVPEGTSAISFAYGAFCCDTGIVVNGLSTPLAHPDGHNFRALDGATLGSVSIDVAWMSEGGGNERGTMTLRGPITTFAVSGTFFAIDDVLITVVPEPASLIYIIAAIPTIFGRRPRRRSIPRDFWANLTSASREITT